jgi:hypothetical protein
LKRRAVMDAMYLIWRMLEEQQEAATATAGAGGAGRA